MAEALCTMKLGHGACEEDFQSKSRESSPSVFLFSGCGNIISSRGFWSGSKENTGMPNGLFPWRTVQEGDELALPCCKADKNGPTP